MYASNVEGVPAFALRPLAVAVEIGFAVVSVGDIVLAGYHINLLFERLHRLIGVVELFVLRQVSDVAGMDDKGRLCRHRVDLGDRLLKGAERIGISRLVEADMTVADLQKGEVARFRVGGGSLADEAQRTRHAAAHGPENAGARPGHALQQPAAV